MGKTSDTGKVIRFAGRRLTDKALKALEVAQGLAWQRGFKSWTPAQLLTGLAFQEGSVSATFLRDNGLGDSALTMELPRRKGSEKRIGLKFEKRPGRGVARFLNFLESVLRDSVDSSIGTELMLVALLETPDRGVDRLLKKFDTDRDTLANKFGKVWRMPRRSAKAKRGKAKHVVQGG